MKEGPVHCTNEQLQTLLDGRVPGPDRKGILAHLQECPVCATRFESLRGLDRSLRRLPMESVGAEFTRKIMGGIASGGGLPIAFRLVENLAYGFAVLVVTGIMLAIFVATGVIDSGQVSEGQTVVGGYLSATGDWIAGTSRIATAWVLRYMPVRGETNLAVSFVVVLGGLALLDRFLHRRFQQRPQ